jgi:hypothetical protein
LAIAVPGRWRKYASVARRLRNNVTGSLLVRTHASSRQPLMPRAAKSTIPGLCCIDRDRKESGDLLGKLRNQTCERLGAPVKYSRPFLTNEPVRHRMGAAYELD